MESSKSRFIYNVIINLRPLAKNNWYKRITYNEDTNQTASNPILANIIKY